MLLRFRVQNHRSLRDLQEFSLIASSLRGQEENLVEAPGLPEPVLRSAAIYGANASGKSNVLSAIEWMRDAVINSQRLWPPDGGVPRKPFALEARYAQESSLFEVDFISEGQRYQYGFEVDSRRVLAEWLHSFPHGRRVTWFDRNEQRFHISRRLSGSAVQRKVLEKLTRPNSLFLSAAVQNGITTLDPIYDWFRQLQFVSAGRRSSFGYPKFTKDTEEALKRILLLWLRAADLGVVGIDVYPEDYDKERRVERLRAQAQQLLQEIENMGAETPNDEFSDREEIALRHQTADDAAGRALPLEDESQGTQAWLALAAPVIRALSHGSPLFIDEMSAKFHPELALWLLRLFNSEEVNAGRAQLIFNTHDTNVLGSGVLRRDQIWFTEKTRDGATKLYPLTDFAPRRHENLERGYLQGRYGSIPYLGSPEALAPAMTADTAIDG